MHLLLVLPMLISGCGIKRYLPGKAVLDAAEVAEIRQGNPAAVTYSGPPRVDGAPLLPVQLFGLYYGLDLVVVSDHPDWDMHEYARIDLPAGPLWLAKDSRAGTLVQSIVADLPDIDTWLPEVPVPRKQGAVDVIDHSEGRDVDVTLAYTNMDGDAVQVHVQGRVKKRPPGKRNGSTMGHSAQAVAVVLDLERFGGAKRVEMSIGEDKRGVTRLLGVYPMRFLLQQAQAGFAVTNLLQTPDADGLTVRRPGPDPVDPATGAPGWPTTATDERWTTSTDASGDALLTLGGDIVSQVYRFRDGELLSGEVWQVGRDLPVLHASFDPALPDLRRPFEGTASSRFELSVDGQDGHGTGTITARWLDADTVELALTPTAPWWLADRPMQGALRFDDAGAAALELHRVPATP